MEFKHYLNRFKKAGTQFRTEAGADLLMSGSRIERAARLADVAKAAGVSQGTVSNVFSRPELVRQEVREHVKAIAASIGYRGPDPRGRMLQGRQGQRHRGRDLGAAEQFL